MSVRDHYCPGLGCNTCNTWAAQQQAQAGLLQAQQAQACALAERLVCAEAACAVLRNERDALESRLKDTEELLKARGLSVSGGKRLRILLRKPGVLGSNGLRALDHRFEGPPPRHILVVRADGARSGIATARQLATADLDNRELSGAPVLVLGPGEEFEVYEVEP